MKLEDALIKNIPSKTRSEEHDFDSQQLQALFTGDDISGLDTTFKRNRKISVTDIDEYLNTLEFSPDTDGVEELPTNSSCGIFKKAYKMKIIEAEQQANQLSGSLEANRSLGSPPISPQLTEKRPCSKSTREVKRGFAFVQRPDDTWSLNELEAPVIGKVANGRLRLLESIRDWRIFLNNQSIILNSIQ